MMQCLRQHEEPPRALHVGLVEWQATAHAPRPPLQRQRFCSQERTSKLPRAKSGKPNVSQLQETPLQTPALLPPSRPPSSMLQTVTRAKLLRPRQLQQALRNA